MKVRIKFTKTGAMKFVGHLDTMRYFQKAIRRAELPVAFSGGYSPHMIMSFAAPLGVGTTSMGEYFDMELTEKVPTAEIEDRLNAVMVEGITISSARQGRGRQGKYCYGSCGCRRLFCCFPAGKRTLRELAGEAGGFSCTEGDHSNQKDKAQRKNCGHPSVYLSDGACDSGVFMQLASASSNYTKPELVMDTFVRWLDKEPQEFAYMIERREVYADAGEDKNPRFLPLEALGEKVE